MGVGLAVPGAQIVSGANPVAEAGYVLAAVPQAPSSGKVEVKLIVKVVKGGFVPWFGII